MAPLGRVVDELLKSSLSVREGLGRAAELHALADVVSPNGTQVTGLTWLADLERNVISDGKVCDIRGDSSNDTARFVAKSKGLLDENVAVAEVVVVVQVGTAESRSLDSDLDLASCKSRQSSFFLRQLAFRMSIVS